MKMSKKKQVPGNVPWGVGGDGLPHLAGEVGEGALHGGDASREQGARVGGAPALVGQLCLFYILKIN